MTPASTILAIDPGAAGGVAWTSGNSVHVAKAPATRGDYIALLRQIIGGRPERCVAYQEKITGFIPDGGASQMFEFGRSVERVGCVLETLGVRLLEIPPQEWQRRFNLGKMGKQRTPAGASPEE